MADHLPTELLSIIGLKLDCTGDRIRFRAVSKSWRSAIPFRQPPWLMLSQSPQEEEEDGTIQPRGFVSVADQSIPKFHFSKIDRARVVGSAGNWLITVHLVKTIRVTDPFSTFQFHLPSYLQLMFVPFRGEEVDRVCCIYNSILDQLTPEWYRDDVFFKIVPSWSQPDGSDMRCVAIVYHNSDQVLSIVRPGDEWWTTLPQVLHSPPWAKRGVEDVIFYKGGVYAINHLGRLIFCDLGDGAGNRPEAWLLARYPTDVYRHPVPGIPKYYLVEWLGELLKIVRYIMTDDDDHDSYTTHTFKIYRVVDLANPNLVELESLGDHSLFLGCNASVSLLASDYFGLVRRNCIYFTDDRRVVDVNGKFIGDERGHDMGVFDLESNTIFPHFEGISTSRYSPPVWIIPQYTM